MGKQLGGALGTQAACTPLSPLAAPHFPLSLLPSDRHPSNRILLRTGPGCHSSVASARLLPDPFSTQKQCGFNYAGKGWNIWGDWWMGFEGSIVGLVCKVKIGKDEGGGGFEEILLRTQRNKNPKEGRRGIRIMRSSWVEESPNENGNNEGKYCLSLGHCKRWLCVLSSFFLFLFCLLHFSLSFFLSFVVNTNIPFLWLIITSHSLPPSPSFSLSLLFLWI